MALKTAFEDDGFEVWDEFSKRDKARYDESNQGTVYQWQHFRKSGVGLGTLFHIAQAHGYSEGAV